MDFFEDITWEQVKFSSFPICHLPTVRCTLGRYLGTGTRYDTVPTATRNSRHLGRLSQNDHQYQHVLSHLDAFCLVLIFNGPMFWEFYFMNTNSRL